MKKLIGIVALIFLVGVLSVNKKPSIANSQTNHAATVEQAVRTVTNNYFDNVKKLEADRRFHCWQEGDRNCTRNSRW